MKKKPKKFRKWLVVDSAIGKLDVFTTHQPEYEGPVYGVFFPQHSAIVIDSSQSEEKMRSTLLHELLHVACTSASETLQKMCLGNREEKIVSFLEPILYDLLTRNGFLKMPKRK
jgi:Zn-dependent peptidase ImmA (M78 family)